MLELYFILGSHHLFSDGYYDDNHVYKALNEQNYGLVLNYEDYLAGFYENSYDENSYLVGKKLTWGSSNIEYGLILGAITGYEYDLPDFKGVSPFVAPYISYNYNNIKPTLLLMGEAVTLSIGYSF